MRGNGANSHRTKGVALVITLAILLMVGLLVLASAVTGLIDRSISANQLRSNSAYYVALGGLELYKTAVFRNLIDYYEEEGVGWCDSPIAGGIRDENGIVILPPGVDEWSGEAPFGAGTYNVNLQVAGSFLVLTSVGTVGDASSTVQLVASAGGGPASAWDNAILAQGAEAGSKAINGNVSVYGSVHIVDGDLDGTLAVGGTSGVFNNYYGEGGSNSDITTVINDIVDTANVDLCARLKIAAGNVYLESGSVQVGTTVDPIYSLHLGDGFVCRAKDPDTGGCKDKDLISDHTETTAVNLRYPEGEGLNSPYSPFDIDLPALEEEAFTTAFATSSGTSGCAWLYESLGQVVLPPSGVSGSSSRCGTAEDYVQWVDGVLEIGGSVNIPDADFTVEGNVEYRGTGSLLVGAGVNDADATVTIDKGSLKPADDLSYLKEFGSAMALMTSGDIIYESTSSLDPSAVLMYAKGNFDARKQPIIVGAVVAESFDLGNQVPKIAYHPEVRFAAERLCLPGTACAGEGAPQNPGVLADIAIERR